MVTCTTCWAQEYADFQEAWCFYEFKHCCVVWSNTRKLHLKASTSYLTKKKKHHYGEKYFSSKTLVTITTDNTVLSRWTISLHNYSPPEEIYSSCVRLDSFIVSLPVFHLCTLVPPWGAWPIIIFKWTGLKTNSYTNKQNSGLFSGYQ